MGHQQPRGGHPRTQAVFPLTTPNPLPCPHPSEPCPAQALTASSLLGAEVPAADGQQCLQPRVPGEDRGRSGWARLRPAAGALAGGGRWGRVGAGEPGAQAGALGWDGRETLRPGEPSRLRTDPQRGVAKVADTRADGRTHGPTDGRILGQRIPPGPKPRARDPCPPRRPRGAPEAQRGGGTGPRPHGGVHGRTAVSPQAAELGAWPLGGPSPARLCFRLLKSWYSCSSFHSTGLS